MSDEERAMEPEVEATIGDLRHELMYAKMMVTRFARKLSEPEVEEAESTVITEGDGSLIGSSITKTTRVRSHQAEADRWIARVASLTKQLFDAELQRLAIRKLKQDIGIGESEATIKAAQAKDAQKGEGVSEIIFTVRRLTAENMDDHGEDDLPDDAYTTILQSGPATG